MNEIRKRQGSRQRERVGERGRKSEREREIVKGVNKIPGMYMPL